MKKYRPNFNDPRIQSRVRQIIGFTTGFISSSEPKSISSKLLKKYFGEYNKEITKYFRHIALICTNHSYSMKDHKSKEYIMNVNGIEYLKFMCENPMSTISYKEWITMCQTQSEICETKEITNNNSIPLCSGSQQIVAESVISPRTSDKRYVDLLLRKEFSKQLISGNFDYNEKSNRLWNELQSVKKEYKIPLLSRFNYVHQYDIEASAPTLILQYARQLGFTKSVNTYEYYLENKTQIRSQLAVEAETTYKNIKVLINALFNGAKLGCNKDFALSQLFDNDTATIEFLKQHKFIQNLRKDIKTVWDFIGSTRKYQYKEHINKQTGEITQRKISLTSKYKWSIYFELEYQVMRSIRTYLIDKSIKYFLEHDGWACDKEIDTNDLCDYVRETTGYKLKFEYENISNRYFDDENDLCETKEITNNNSIPLCSGSQQIVASKKKALTSTERSRLHRQRKSNK